MLSLGLDKIVVILLVALIVVGPQRLPEISRKLGQSLRHFQRLSAQAQEQVRAVVPEEITAPFNDLRQTLRGSTSTLLTGSSAPTFVTSTTTEDKEPLAPPQPVDLGPEPAIEKRPPLTASGAPPALPLPVQFPPRSATSD